MVQKVTIFYGKKQEIITIVYLVIYSKITSKITSKRTI
ncbi:hypothetical protein UF75_0392 [Desulfosporosinus sp. I2]|nr:hypothetical protein UF75_0392 [Desulfosporosinus sp. I2]